MFAAVVMVLAYCYVSMPGLREVTRPYHCLFYQLTGLFCPACGGTRSIIHLLDGRLLLALKSNALAVIMLPVIGYGLATASRLALDRRFSPVDIKIAPFLVWSVLAVVIVFWIIRNLSFFSFLNPV